MAKTLPSASRSALPAAARSAALLTGALAMAACGALGCTDQDPVEATAVVPDDIAFAELGPVALASGAGSFRFGAASAATQIEDDNPTTDWYAWTLPEDQGGLGQGEAFVGDASKGYTMAIEDIALITALGLDSYRFSIEWARVEPQRDVIDEEALAHYDAFIDALVAAGVRPMVTVHHFSNPVWVADPADPDCASGPGDDNLCGLGHAEGGPLVVDEMAEHAALLAERFGDRVDEWATVNEPVNYLLAAYGVGAFPPGQTKVFALLEEFVPVVRDYALAHAAMYRALDEGDTVDADGDGDPASVGLTLSVGYWEPAAFNAPSEDPSDVTARDRLEYVYHHLLVDAIRAGRFDSDLDGELDTDLPELQGTLDWLGVQYYFRAGVTGQNGLIPVLELTPCFSTFDFGACLPPKDPSFCVPAMGYEFWAPGLYHVLVDFAERWPDLPLMVTESGLATEQGIRRAEHVVRSLEQIARARAEGVDVRGYYHWSLYDNFEWAEGFEPRFGLYHVDYDTFTRTPTEGAEVLGVIASARLLHGADRAKYGGDGAMTLEDPEESPRELCSGF